MTSIEQALNKLEQNAAKELEKIKYVSNTITKADELISQSINKEKALIIEYYKDDHGVHSLALDRSSEKAAPRIFYECYNPLQNQSVYYKPLVETKVHTRIKMFEYLPDFLEKFMLLSEEADQESTQS